MNKYVFPTLAVGLLLLGLWIGNAVSNKANAQRFYIQNGRIYQQPSSKLDQLFNLLERGYVDSLNIDSIQDVAMAEVVKQLDPHSAYIPAKDIEMVNSQLSGSFSGIGVQFSIQNDTVSVVSVISGGPSEKVGLLAGDKIVEVDDTVFVGKQINNERVMHKLRGEKGTIVRVGVVRRGTNDLLHYDIVRGDIPIKAVDAKFITTATSTGSMSGQKIGFIIVNKFGETTYKEFLQALSELKQQGAKGYIVDLRQNSGGYMDQAIKMANEFLDAGEMIVYAEGRAYPRYEARANGMGRFRKEPLIVLIDDFSASASEIFAGAMQDNDRGKVIGRRSFGKGLVQQQLPFEDGSAVRLTVARYYTPSGRSIQKPYKLGDQEDYEKDILERFEKGEFYSADSIQMQDSTIYRTKNGRIVYGGGGIMPDVFVGRDTTMNTPYANRLINLAYTYQFAYQYTDNHRKELGKFKTWQELEQYLKSQKLVEQLADFAAKKGQEKNAGELEKSRPMLQRLVIAYIVRDILGDEGFYPLFERDDEISKAALREF